MVKNHKVVFEFNMSVFSVAPATHQDLEQHNYLELVDLKSLEFLDLHSRFVL